MRVRTQSAAVHPLPSAQVELDWAELGWAGLWTKRRTHSYERLLCVHPTKPDAPLPSSQLDGDASLALFPLVVAEGMAMSSYLIITGRFPHTLFPAAHRNTIHNQPLTPCAIPSPVPQSVSRPCLQPMTVRCLHTITNILSSSEKTPYDDCWSP